MAKKKTEKQTKPQKVMDIARVPLEMPTIYVNHAEIAFSVFDATIVLGEIQDADRENNVLNVHPRAKLIMSHRFIVEFAKLITKNLELFVTDEDFGRVPEIVVTAQKHKG